MEMGEVFKVGGLYVLYTDIDQAIKKDPELFRDLLESRKYLLLNFSEIRFVMRMKVVPFLFLDKEERGLEYFYDGIPFTVMECDKELKKVLIFQIEDGVCKMGYLKILPRDSKERSCKLYRLIV